MPLPVNPYDDVPCPVSDEDVDLAYEDMVAAGESGDTVELRRAMKAYKAAETLRDRWLVRYGSTPFIDFVRLVRPDIIIGLHHKLLGHMYKDIAAKKLIRLIVQMPPGHTKSLFGSILLPAWLFGLNPAGRIIGASHTLPLVEEFSDEIKAIVRSDEYRRLFPDVEVRKDRSSDRRWGTPAGGKYTAVGVGGAVAGKRADMLGSIDDPISEQDAYSDTKMAAVNRWYPGGFRSRVMPGTPIVITMTRWATNDLAGDRQAQALAHPEDDQWTVVSIPAILDEESAALLNSVREPGDREAKAGDTPFPEIWPLKEMLKIKAGTPPHQWSALYMQEPVLDGGNILRADWWRPWPAHKKNPEIEYLLQVWDTAFQDKEQSDWSVCTVWGVFFDVPSDQYAVILLGRYRERVAFPILREDAHNFYLTWNKTETGGPVDEVLVEEKASGTSLLQELRRRGVPVRAWEPERRGGKEASKLVRAHAASVPLYSGAVYYPEGRQWAQEIIDECATFPFGAHDDQVDTVTMALIWLRRAWWINSVGDPEEDDAGDPNEGRIRKAVYG